jgi:hypothetical protein
MNMQDRLKEIEAKRLEQLEIIWAAQDRMKELNTQRENILMSEDEGDVEN